MEEAEWGGGRGAHEKAVWASSRGAALSPRSRSQATPAQTRSLDLEPKRRRGSRAGEGSPVHAPGAATPSGGGGGGLGGPARWG